MCVCSCAKTLPAHAHVYIMPARLAIVFAGFNVTMMKTRTAIRAEDTLVTGCPGIHIVVQRLMSSEIDLNGRLC